MDQKKFKFGHFIHNVPMIFSHKNILKEMKKKKKKNNNKNNNNNNNNKAILDNF